jgi:hypothetical protein
MKTTIAMMWMIGGCASAPIAQEQPGPRGLRADQHLTLAQDHDEYADELQNWPDTRPSLEANDGIEANNAQQEGEAARWYAPFNTTSEHRRDATLQRAQAAEQDADYAQACGDRPLAAVAVSPLRRYGIGGNDIPGGVVVLLSPEAGRPDQVLASMRCHRAWLMLGPARANGADESLLDLANLHISAVGDPQSIAVSIIVDDPKLVPELRRRAAHELEAGAGR